MIAVAIIGCGNIGTEIARYLKSDQRFSIVVLADNNAVNFSLLAKELGVKFHSATISNAVKRADLIIEAAGKEAVKEILACRELDKPGKHLMVMSTGGLADNLSKLKKIKQCRVHIPSGAIAGLDAIHAVQGKINSLTLTTTKPAAGLKNAPYILRKKVILDNLKIRKKIFEGSLHDAILGFPQNINVAASLYLASQFNRIKISIVADAKTKFNTHEIVCKGSFGEIHTVTKNLPSKNPKTSYLAILSALAAVKNVAENISIGN